MKERSMRFCVLLFSLTAFISFGVGAASAEDDGGFYKGRKGGFYWYEDDPPAETEAFFEMPQPDLFAYAELWRMNPERMAEVLENRKLIAIHTPTEENARRYIEAQDVAKRKSMAFAGAIGAAAQLNPRFSNTNTASMVAPARHAYYQAKSEEIENILNFAAQDFALIVFESPGCHYCEAQRPILERFRITYGWTVRYVDIDEHRPMAEQYGIDITPSVLMLAREQNTAVPISSGVVSMADLRKRLMRAIRYMRGETEPAQWFNEEGVTDPLKYVGKGRAGR
jgi:conjugal transfer pilus assembly protein TraF